MERSILRRAVQKAQEDAWLRELTGALGFSPTEAPINFLAEQSSALHSRLADYCEGLYRVGAIEAAGVKAGLWVGRLPTWGEKSAPRQRARRHIAKSLIELAPGGDRNNLLVLSAHDSSDIELVLPRERSNGQLGTVRAVIDTVEPNRYHLELLESLVVEDGERTATINRKWTNAFNTERVTKKFYLEFRLLRDRLVEDLLEHNKASELVASGLVKPDKGELRKYVTRNLGRILFLWFIQQKGWLDSDQHYLANLYARYCREGQQKSYFSDVLIPLFFDALAKKPEDRPAHLSELGEIPYLNGGLFIPTAFEDALYGEEREHVRIMLPNYAFDDRQHDHDRPTVLGLLTSYRFTTRESTPDDQSLDPDPELLGKVFENLNEDRKKTGTYYTPREVVRFMCRRALDGYLTEKAGIAQEAIDDLRLEAIDPSLTERHLPPEERDRLKRGLLEVQVCDPAVGSGAFPVGMLQEIVTLLVGLEQSADVIVNIGGQQVADWKQHVVTHCLYGVDINPEAVEVCHLRLWLSMVIDADQPVPLPNLDFRFEAGDSLIDRFGTISFAASIPPPEDEHLSLDESFVGLHEIERLRDKYASAGDPSEARRLRAAIREAELSAVFSVVEDRLTETQEALKAREKEKNELEKYGETGEPKRRVTDAIKRLKAERQKLESFKGQLGAELPYKKPFFWPVAFPEVFQNGGFDVVVANPPYVRQESLSETDQESFEHAFPEVYKPTADLYVQFFGRAVQILKDGGRLSFITSNKFHRAGYGEKLRAYLPKVLSLERVIDFGDLSVFDAIAYPSITVGGKTPPSNGRVMSVSRLTNPVRLRLRDRGVTENVSTVREELEGLEDLLAQHQSPGFPQVLLRKDGWVLEDPKLVRLFERIMNMGTPLGEFIEGRMYYGIKTGRNEAFVIDQPTRDRLIAEDPKGAELIKPWLRGKDIKRWRAEWAGLYVIFR